MLLVRAASLQMALFGPAAAMWRRRQGAQGLPRRQVKARQILWRRLPGSSLHQQRSMQDPALQELHRQRPCRSRPITCRRLRLRLAAMCLPLILLELQMMGMASWCGTWCSR